MWLSHFYFLSTSTSESKVKWAQQKRVNSEQELLFASLLYIEKTMTAKIGCTEMKNYVHTFQLCYFIFFFSIKLPLLAGWSLEEFIAQVSLRNASHIKRSERRRFELSLEPFGAWNFATFLSIYSEFFFLQD